MYKILIVEDNDINRKVLCGYLNRDNISLSIATNGIEAVSHFNNSRYDLILMDIAMPEMDGLQATIEIRKKEARGKNRTPIIAVTAYDEDEKKHAFFDAGMDDYIIKPVTPLNLQEKINKYLKIRIKL